MRDADNARLAEGWPHTGTAVVCCSGRRQGVVVGRNRQTVAVRHCGFQEDKYDVVQRNYCLQAISPLIRAPKALEESSEIVFLDWRKHKQKGVVVETIGPLTKVIYQLKNSSARSCWIDPTRILDTETPAATPVEPVDLDS